MERNCIHELCLKTVKSDCSLLTLQWSWPEVCSHVLIVVNTKYGEHGRMVLFKRSPVTRWQWPGYQRETEYNIQVYGLNIDTTTGQDGHRLTRDSERESLFSVESTKILNVTTGPGDIGAKTISVKLEQTQPRHTYSFMDHYDDITHESFGAQEDLEMEVEDSPPLTYNMKAKSPQRQTKGFWTLINCRKDKKNFLLWSTVSRNNVVRLLPICKSRREYRVRAIAVSSYCPQSKGQAETVATTYTPCSKSDVKIIKTYMSKEDLQTLMEKAKSYCGSHTRYPRMYKITRMYRNKPRHYYANIVTNRSGVMEKYIKDNNGDPYSAINRKINGLFFSASLDTRTMMPPPFSYFGDTRLTMPAEELISNVRMYFADFFCHYQTHYVTVVIAKKGSNEDLFCQARLLELDLENNPFFIVEETGNQSEYGYQRLINAFEDQSLSEVYQPNRFQYQASPSSLVGLNSTPSRCVPPAASFLASSRQNDVKKVFKMVSADKFHVEFLYTEDVDILGLIRKYGADKVYFRSVEGKGVSKSDGIPKNPNCSVCNLERQLSSFLDIF